MWAFVDIGELEKNMVEVTIAKEIRRFSIARLNVHRFYENLNKNRQVAFKPV